MGLKLNLMDRYPRVKNRLTERIEISDHDREIASKFDFEYFDGPRQYGYGGYYYHPKYWTATVDLFINYYKLSNNSRILDVGCAKGFMLYDLSLLIPNITLAGIDVSEYAIENAVKEVKPFVSVASAINLPFDDNSFDVVISINTVHNLEREECAKSLQEIERVSKGNSYITVDAYRNEEEKKRMFDWNLTAKTIMSVDEWVIFFNEIGYTGDYYWFIP